MIIDRHKNYTLQEMKEARPLFFKNRLSPERYSVRSNHLIVHNLEDNIFWVWQFHSRNGQLVLSPVWKPLAGTMDMVRAMVGDMLRDGTFPLHSWS